MKTNDFISRLDDTQVVQAIAEAEKKTTGEIRVHVSSKKQDDAIAAARARFVKLGMEKTRQRNAVLVYFAPVTQQFAIIGDEGIHAKCGQPFWEEVRDAMAEHLKAGRYTEAVVASVHKVGTMLARHFPAEPGDTDELPNKVLRD